MSAPTQAGFDAVIFDLGGVVLRWEPEPAYASVLPPDQIADFLTMIDFYGWNHRLDAGQRFAVGEQELITRFPDQADAIRAYQQNFAATLTGMVPGTSAIIAELAAAGLDLVGLTNWSDETFPYAEQRFGILRRLRGILVSGAEGVAKPDPEIFTLTCRRFGLDAARTIFVDDVAANVAAADAFGITALRFTDADTLRRDLTALGVLGAPVPVAGPIRHLAVAAGWTAAQENGDYPWSTRGVGYEAEGYVHCSFPDQVAGVRSRYYADLADDELVLLRLRPDAGPIVVEDLGAGAFPHLYAPLHPDLVEAVETL